MKDSDLQKGEKLTVDTCGSQIQKIKFPWQSVFCVTFDTSDKDCNIHFLWANIP